jgi:hypothetical protein
MLAGRQVWRAAIEHHDDLVTCGLGERHQLVDEPSDSAIGIVPPSVRA